MPARAFALLLAGLGWFGATSAAVAAPATAAWQREYERQVLPVLRQFCFDCHGGGASKGKLAFDTYESFEGLLADKATWKKATQFLHSHVMPPAEKPQPSLAQRKLLLDWIDRTVFYADPQRPDPGHVTLRRLNRNEYNNSVRDIFRLEASPADQFPPDDSGYGFDNVADALTLSPLLMEKYFQAARQVLDEALRLETTARVGIERDDAKLTVFAGQPEVSTNGVTLLKSAADEVGVELIVPVRAHYRVLTRAAATKHGETLARLAVLLDGRPIAELEPKAEWKGRKLGMPGVFALVELPAGKHRVSLRLAGDGPAWTSLRSRGRFRRGIRCRRNFFRRCCRGATLASRRCASAARTPRAAKAATASTRARRGLPRAASGGCRCSCRRRAATASA
jgi:hypothetical protein